MITYLFFFNRVVLSANSKTNKRDASEALLTEKQIKAKLRRQKHKTGIRSNEENGIVKTNTNPILEHGYLDDMEEKAHEFDQWLISHLDLEGNKNKARQRTYSGTTKANGFNEFIYKMITFYSEKALKHLYPGEVIKSVITLDNGASSTENDKSVAYEDIPNNFLAELAEKLSNKISSKRQFCGMLERENRNWAEEGENMERNEDGEFFC